MLVQAVDDLAKVLRRKDCAAGLAREGRLNIDDVVLAVETRRDEEGRGAEQHLFLDEPLGIVQADERLPVPLDGRHIEIV